MRRSVAAAGSSLFMALAPGTVAGLVPWWLTGWHGHPWWPPARVIGGALVLAGGVVLVQAFGRFVVEGSARPRRWRLPSTWWSAGSIGMSATPCISR
jgi:hypothetical protein